MSDADAYLHLAEVLGTRLEGLSGPSARVSNTGNPRGRRAPVNRQNVYADNDLHTPGDGMGAGERLVGWFDLDAAHAYDEDTWWDGSNHISRATGSQWEHERLYRTAQGRWVHHAWSQRQGVGERWSFATDSAAREWLLSNGHDTAVEEHFGEIETERGPGRPEVGPAINVRLDPDLLRKVENYATTHTYGNRAEAIRNLLQEALPA